jgi:hypothetical protein
MHHNDESFGVNREQRSNRAICVRAFIREYKTQRVGKYWILVQHCSFFLSLLLIFQIVLTEKINFFQN